MVESSYFPKPEFQEALSAYVLLRMNAQGTPAEREAYRRYAGESLPTYVVLEPDGTRVAYTGWAGGPDADAVLLAWLKANVR